ncbi:phage tail assembly chaperone [Faecalibacillus faecis]|uniref:phage tail assembly chaperone n=1 Tax=Faecalibacillus faecis TaxID=1982628 RepID=UPI00386F0688
MKKEIKLQNSGKMLIINTASTAEVKYLKNVLLEEVKKYPIGLKLLGSTESVFDKQVDFTSVFDFIKNVLISVDISETAENAIFECLKHCVYDRTHKITLDLFDEIEEAREDYYEIIFACIEENLKPFIKSLVSMWKIQAEKLGKSQLLSMILNQLT